MVTYSTYYPANALPHGYLKGFLKLSIGLCMGDDAPPAITEDMFVKKGLIKPCKGTTLYRKYEEKREADILQQLEKVLADIVGGESTNV